MEEEQKQKEQNRQQKEDSTSIASESTTNTIQNSEINKPNEFNNDEIEEEEEKTIPKNKINSQQQKKLQENLQNQNENQQNKSNEQKIIDNEEKKLPKNKIQKKELENIQENLKQKDEKANQNLQQKNQVQQEKQQQKSYQLSQEDKKYEEYQKSIMKNFKSFFKPEMFKQIMDPYFQVSDKYLAPFTIHTRDDQDYQQIKYYFQEKSNKWEDYQKENPKLSKCIAAFLGNAVGDALGAHTEFEYFQSQHKLLKGESWDDLSDFCGRKFRTKFGVVTDDCSMAKCMADSLLSNNMEFNPIDMRMRFLLWWNLGYCNGSVNRRSFGLGGNIAQGFQNFISGGMQPFVIKDFSQYKNGQISGNGGIMRLSPIPIAYHDNLQKGEQIAVLQSLTSHNGYEAGELCKLLTHLVIQLINYQGNDPKKDVLEKLGETFQSDCKSVMCMARSQQEPVENLQLYHQNFNKTIEDRYWDWKQPDIKVSPTRHYQQATYYGSYAMDGAYVALHTVYHSSSTKEGIFKAVNYGGDSDSIAAVIGYISGAMYGLQDDMLQLYNEKMLQYDDYQILVKAQKLFYKQAIKDASHYEEDQNNEKYYIEQLEKVLKQQ